MVFRTVNDIRIIFRIPVLNNKKKERHYLHNRNNRYLH